MEQQQLVVVWQIIEVVGLKIHFATLVEEETEKVDLKESSVD